MQYSHSRVSTFEQCPYQYKLRYIDNLTTIADDSPTNPLILGSALHTGLELGVEAAINQYYNSYYIISDEHINEALKLEVLIGKAQKILPTGEYEYCISTDDFLGYVDMLVENGDGYDIYEFKYSNNIDNYLQSRQLHLYSHYIDKPIKNLIFVFIPKIKIRQKKTETIRQFRNRLYGELEHANIKVIPIEYNEQKVQEFQNLIEQINTTKKYPKNKTKLCEWCEFQNYCERKDDTMILPENKRRDLTVSSKKTIWLYGLPFSGKTYLANQFPDPLMINTDGNIRQVDAPYIAIKDIVTVHGRYTSRKMAWQLFKEVLEELEKKENNFKTIIVDLLEDCYEHCRLYMYKKLNITHEADESFTAWDKVRTEFLSTIKKLVNLDYDNIILISHEDRSKDLTKKSGDKITAIKPNLPEKIATKIAGMMDLVARVINDDGARALSFKADSTVFGGGRFTVNEQEIPLDYEKLMSVYDNHATPEPQQKQRINIKEQNNDNN